MPFLERFMYFPRISKRSYKLIIMTCWSRNENKSFSRRVNERPSARVCVCVFHLLKRAEQLGLYRLLSEHVINRMPSAWLRIDITTTNICSTNSRQTPRLISPETNPPTRPTPRPNYIPLQPQNRQATKQSITKLDFSKEPQSLANSVLKVTSCL